MGNALADQNRYENRAVLDIARDIQRLHSGVLLQNLTVSGRLGLSPGASLVAAKFPFASSTIRTADMIHFGQPCVCGGSAWI